VKKTGSILIVGVDLAALACSARKAGYEVYAADYFGDLDLRNVCNGYLAIIEQKPGKSCGKFEEKYNPELFLNMVKSIIKKKHVDFVLLSSGLDDHFDILYELNDLIPILGNSPQVFERVRSKSLFFRELKRLNIPHPETDIAQDLIEAVDIASDFGYPILLKPLKGFAGVGIRKAENVYQLKRAFEFISSFSKEGVLIQKFIEGVDASISFIASRGKAEVLTVNEQLIGLSEVYQREPFGYCGNIVPLDISDEIMNKCKKITIKIAERFKLEGSNGIDIVISREGTPYVVEVNPRFQGTLECVEKVLNVNLVELHVNACIHGKLPKTEKYIKCFCTRLILYALRRVMVPDLAVMEGIRDIPLPKVIIEGGEPICSVIEEGESRFSSLMKAKSKANFIYGMLIPV